MIRVAGRRWNVTRHHNVDAGVRFCAFLPQTGAEPCVAPGPPPLCDLDRGGCGHYGHRLWNDLDAPHDMVTLATETFRAFDATVMGHGRLFGRSCSSVQIQ